DLAPELVWVSTPSSRMKPGPSDDRMYVIEPIGKDHAYGVRTGPYGTPFLDLPPWPGRIRRPAFPDRSGHFDRLPLDAPEFAQAHAYGCVRFTLDVWESYFGRRIGWHFARDFDRLEVLLRTGLDNALVGYGFMEVGAQHEKDGA